MSKPFSHSPFSVSRWTPFLAGIAVFAAVSTATAQPGIIRPGQVLTQRVPSLQIKIAPELQNYLVAQKPKVEAEVIDRSFVLQNGTPAFKLPDGSTRLLMPVKPQPNPGNNGGLIPRDLADAKSYILTPPKLGIRRTTPFKIGPLLTLSTGVDHTSSMTPIRDQGPRGTCVAFAANGALEPFASIPNDLSEQYTYHMCLQQDGKPFNYNDGTYTETVMDIMKAGTVVESVWPYSNALPPSNESVPSGASGAAKYKITDAQFIGDNGLSGASIKNPNYLETILNQGKNIVFATEVAWYGAHNDDVIDVLISGGYPAYSRGRHEMVIVGYNSAKDYFIVRNSWGTGFGHAGYAFMSYDYIRTYAVNGFYIKAVSPNMLIQQTPKADQIFKGDIKIKPRILKPR